MPLRDCTDLMNTRLINKKQLNKEFTNGKVNNRVNKQ